ncbi:MAG: metallophosphoesterase [Vampirovibrionales bacterium]|nr:metallophosphoesterase [Vampirovibrionales bacterium]
MPHPALMSQSRIGPSTPGSNFVEYKKKYRWKPRFNKKTAIALDRPRHPFLVQLLARLSQLLCPMPDFTLKTYSAGIPKLPQRLDGLILVQLSDIQCYEYAPAAYWEKMIRAVEALDPDIIVVTGDVIHHGETYLKQAHDILAALPKIKSDGVTPVERLLCMGNHDYMDHAHADEQVSGKVSKGKLFRQVAKKAGFKVLVDNAIRLGFGQDITAGIRKASESDGHSALLEGLWVSGIDDYEHLLSTGKKLEEACEDALRQIPENAAHLLLTHNPHPDIINQMSRNARKAPGLILAGHMHGGQIASRLPLLGPLLDSLRRRVMEGPFDDTYLQGAYHLDKASALYVNPGIGSSIRIDRFGLNLFPLRLGSTPEITRFILHPAISASLKPS